MSVANSCIIIKFLELTIPFLLGLFSSLIIDKIRFNFKKKHIKKFILNYLEESILEKLPELKDEYSKFYIQLNSNITEFGKVNVFESFNGKSLEGITQIEYYRTFKNTSALLHKIKSLIDYLSFNLPQIIMTKYFIDINNHLKEKSEDLEHLNKCEYCISAKKRTIEDLKFRIMDIDDLKTKIENFIDNINK